MGFLLGVGVDDETTVSTTGPLTRAMLPTINRPQLTETGEVLSCSDWDSVALG